MDISSYTLVFATIISFVNFCESTESWSVVDEDVICSLASQKPTFCTATGPADDGCKMIAGNVSGTDPKCEEDKVCSFTKGGTTAYVTCDSVKKGYGILRNCINNIAIAIPDPKMNLGDPSRMVNQTGKEGCGSYETTSVTPHSICNVTNEETIYYCESQTLRDELIKTFHPEKRIGNLCGGVCMDIRNSSDDKNFKQVFRCVFSGTFYNDQLGQRDICRFHLFNQDLNIVAMSYWGSKNILDMESSPLSAPTPVPASSGST